MGKVKKKGKRFTINEPMHSVIIECFVGFKFQEVKDYLKSLKYDLTEVEESEDCKGMFACISHSVEKDRSLKFLFVEELEPTIEMLGVINHECLHAAEYVFDECGIPISWDNTEALAYYLEWLTKEVYKGIGIELKKIAR